MAIYHKIYKTFYDSIPKDQNGRSFEIHHIDGDRTNNSILNLVALSIQDHYDVHYIQGDYGACWKIAERFNLSNEEISNLGRQNAKYQIERGIHPWQGDHSKKLQAKRVREKTHNLLGPQHNLNRMKNGTHPSQTKITCPKCNETFSKNVYACNGHGENCMPKYILISPNGEQHEIYKQEDVTKFGLQQCSMWRALQRGKPLHHGKNKGWQLIKKT
jgi:hypothetical protein